MNVNFKEQNNLVGRMSFHTMEHPLPKTGSGAVFVAENRQ